MDGSGLLPVCKDCYELIDFHNLPSEDECSKHGSEYMKTMATYPCGSLYIFTMETNIRRRPEVPPGPIGVCAFNHNCRNGSSCISAHTAEEYIVWNRHSRRMCIKCVEQQFEELIKLQEKLCTSNHGLEGFKNGILWTGAVTSTHFQNLPVFHIFRPLPKNVDDMNECQYKFRHTHYDCPSSFAECTYPHSREEDSQWNQWKDKGKTPVTLLDSALEKYVELHVTDEMKSVKKQVAQERSQRQSYADHRAAKCTVEFDELQPSNYKNWFHSLLVLEEEYLHDQLNKMCATSVSMDAVFDHYEDYEEGHFRYYFSVKMACDTAEFLSHNASSIEVEFVGSNASRALKTGKGAVTCVNAVPHDDDDTGLILSTETPLNDGSYKVKFLNCQQKSTWGKFHPAVEDVTTDLVLRLFPQYANFKFAVETDCVKMDYAQYEESVQKEKHLELDHIFQQEAAEAILNCPVGPPFLVTGPFGTGKTRLIARLTHQLLHTEPNSRVLISVHHYQTADSYPWSFFSNLSQHFPLPCKLIRLVPYAKKANTNARHNMIITCTANQFWRYCHTHCEVRLVVTTNGTAGRLLKDVKLPRGHFTHIFLDEAAQCTEPEALMPLLLAGPHTKIILAGDHLQVGPEDRIRSPDAKKHGLNMSLLGRLHCHYAQISKKSGLKDSPLIQKFMANLLTNYRCDAGILRLPSNLFYECSLLARAQYELHPDTNSSLLFVCTSLQSGNLQWSDSEETNEIYVMLQKVEDLCLNWPEAWKDFGTDNSVCLMARTHQQLTKIRKQLSGKKKEVRRMLKSKELQLRTTYNIQGLEYTVVFLCTTEPYVKAANGQVAPKPDAIGTSIVNKRVFNTVLTRARTMFVAIGNPFYLMQAEGNASSELGAGICWKEYLRKCIESDSIELPPHCSERERQALLEKVFDDQDPLGRYKNESDVEQDSILEQYSTQIRRKLLFIGGNWVFKAKEEKEHNTKSTGESSRVSNEWKLVCKSPHLAEAVPKICVLRRFSIQGVMSRGRALNGAVVEVAADSNQHSTDSSSLPLGRVVSVIQQSAQKLFLCRIDQFNSNLFVPLDGLGPKLANLPGVSRKLIQIDKAQKEIEERKRGYAAFRKNPVACFDLHSLERDIPIPRLRDVISLESAKKLMFIVKYIQWNENNVYPMAAVVGTFPVAHTQFHAIRVLKAYHQGREDRSADTPVAMEGFSRHMLSDGSGVPTGPISGNPEKDMLRLDLALQCTQSSKLYPEAKVSQTDGKFFLIDLPNEPCGPLKASQPAFCTGCEKVEADLERMAISFKFKLCSTRNCEVVLHEFIHSETALNDKVDLSLVATDKESKEIKIIKGWIEAARPTPAQPEAIAQAGVLFPNISTSSSKSTVSNSKPSSERLALHIQPDTMLGRLNRTEINLYSFTIEYSITVDQVLPVWIVANTSGLIIEPEVQLVKPAPYLDICMQHSTRAAQCFSSPILQNASLERYRDIDEYVTLWESVLMAEAAESSVKDGELLFIDCALLDWPREGFKPVNNLLKADSYFFEGNVTLGLSEEFINQCGRFVKLERGDFVCARYEFPMMPSSSHPSNDIRGVFHFVVQSCTKGPASCSLQKVKQCVKLKMIGEHNSMVSKAMYQKLTFPKGSPPCTLQVIQCMVPQRRMYQSLLKLKESSCSFVTSVVACGHLNLIQPNKLVVHPSICEDAPTFLESKHDFTHLWSGSGKRLNTKQMEAMKKALQYKFTLIQGPPGTGKSVTGAHLAYVFAKLNQRDQVEQKNRCVLYCAPSNKAVDVVLGYLHELCSRGSANVSILRIYSRAIELKAAGGGPRQNEQVFKQIHVDLDSGVDRFKAYSLNEKVKATKYGPEIAKLEEKFCQLKEDGSIPSWKAENEYHYLLRSAEDIVFEANKFDIVLCTCNEAASNRVSRHVHPHQCIIDECGFAIEPDAMIPLQCCQHVVLIGDHKQLQPVIKNSAAGESGLKRSLFERYADMYTNAREKQKKHGEETGQDRHAYTQLQEQYRMHEGICDPPSATFYDGTLIPADSIGDSYESFNQRTNGLFASFWQNPNMPVKVIDVVGCESSPSSAFSGSGGPESKQNPKEAIEVASTAQHLIDDYNLTQEDIVVLSPYRGQKDCISRELQTRLLSDIAVRTVNESQGSEANVVILSTVRSMPTSDFDPRQLRGDRSWSMEHLGFVTDPHQICVGITRSKFGLIIVGNTRLLSCDPTWNKLLQLFRSH